MTSAKAWLEATRTVTVSHARRIAATPEAVLAAAATDLAFTEPSAMCTFPVPHLEPALTCWVVRANRGAVIRVRQDLPATGPNELAWLDMASGLRRRLTVEAARGGSKARIEHTVEVQRQHVRDAKTTLDSQIDPALARLALVSTGFAAPATPRVDALRSPAASLTAGSADIPATRTLPAAPAQVWAALTAELMAGNLLRFWVDGVTPAVGAWLCYLPATGTPTLYEVAAWEPQRELTLLTLVTRLHPAILSWSLRETNDGTEVTVHHRCASSHVGLGWDIADELDRLQRSLPS